jgi:serine/threonine-protein kinase
MALNKFGTPVYQNLDEAPIAIGAYRITKTLGKGSFGVVYQAYQPFLDRYVAIKTMHSDFAPSEKHEQIFMKEARAIARLRHPNIVTVYEFGIVASEYNDNTHAFMVMEALPGKSLQERMKSGRLTVPEIVAIVEQLGQALDYAHEKGIVHRDLKPANILFTELNQPVIVDFGLVQLLQIDRSSAPADTTNSDLKGTLAYMAPEQFMRQPTGPATDRYALAIVAYEMLTGTKLLSDFSRVSELLAHPDSLNMAVTLSLPDTMSQIEPILLKALSTNPADRFSSTGAFARALSEALLPDRQVKQSVFISDPRQAIQIRLVRQTITGFLWGIAAIAFFVMLFCMAIWVRGYANGSHPLFVWDGIMVYPDTQPGQLVVTGLWPGDAGAQSGIQIGDVLKHDLLAEYSVQNGDYTVNGLPRSALRLNWAPQLGDVIQRTVLRDGQPVLITYTITRSWQSLLLLVVYGIPALVSCLCLVRLLMRLGPEPGVRILFPLLLSAAFLFLSAALTLIIHYMDAVALHIFLPSLLLFALIFPEPLPILVRRPWLKWLIYLPLIIPLLEMLIGVAIQVPFLHFEIPTITGSAYAIAIVPAVYFKWRRRDLKHYYRLRALIASYMLIPVVVLPSILIFTLGLATSMAIFGNFFNMLLTSYVIVSLGGTVTIIAICFGYEQLQRQIGPSFITQDRLAESDFVPPDRTTVHD